MTENRFRNPQLVSPSDVRAGDAFAIKVVAVVGHADDWVAYYGPSYWDKQRVADEGDKLARGQAEPLFYVLRFSGRHYRE